MADLNARIKPKKSSTAGEVPQATDLEVAEIAVNTADGKLFVKHTDNSIKEISGAGGGGATAINDLTDVDTVTANPTFSESFGNLTTYPLAGIDGWYADQAAMEADGFTYIASSANADDLALPFTPPAKFSGVNYLNNGVISSGQWFINSNGGVGVDASGSTTNDRSGNSLTAAASIDLYVSWMNQDIMIEGAGFKEYTAEGKTWLVVRMDAHAPTYTSTDGLALEAWFATDGSVSVRYGTAFGTASFTVGANKNVIVSNGVAIGQNPFPSLSSSGAYAYNNTNAGGGPIDGQVLTWVGANSQWEPVDASSGTVDSVNGNTGTVVVDLDSATTQGATTNNDISVGDLLTVQGDGAAQDGRLKLNCSANTHGVTIQSPPHSDAATYTLTLPSSAGTAGQVLTSQGGSQLTWENAAAVDSVNGRTGAVVLDLEDLDNVLATKIFFSNYTTAVDINNTGEDGDWATNPTFRYFYFWNLGSENDMMSQLQVGDTVTFDWSDAATTVNTVTSAATSAGSQASYIILDSSSGWPTSGTVTVTSSRFTPADGSTLTWIAADSTWAPTSLRIQDMSDYEPNIVTSASSRFDVYNASLNANGQWAQDTLGLYIRKVDSDGNDVTTENGYGGTDIWYSQDGTSWTSASGTFNDSTNFVWWSIGNPNLNTGQSLYVAFTDPSTGSSTVPLADGDILQWVGADSKFKPTALDAAGARTLLGIGEYVDDAAAGTGGVASGAMYYNTTSSDYRLKS